MRITAITARTVRWPIAGQGAARGRTERAAVVLEVRSAGGAIGLGEAAPLPGISLDTLDEAEQAIAAFARYAPFDVELPPYDRRPVNVERVRRSGAGEHTIVFDPRPLLDIADREAMHAFLVAPPSARFAIETALLDALGRERGRSIAALFGAREHRPLPLAAVVDGPEQARRACADGIRCLKVKLAADDDPGRAFAIAAAVPEARLRIDANRSWPRADVAARLAALAALPIEYVEEPCRDTHQLLSGSLPCPIALDEGLLAMTEVEICVALRSTRLAAVVLKPTLLGGFSAVFPLAALAQRCRVPPIISHALEGPIGTAGCAEIARVFGGSRAVGLAAHAALAGWPVVVPQLAADHVHAASEPGLGFEPGLGLGLGHGSGERTVLPSVEPREPPNGGPPTQESL